MNTQLPLGLSLDDQATFDNYFLGSNAVAVDAALACANDREPRWIFFWGADGSGRTHLLQSLCHVAAERDAKLAYLPMSQARTWTVDVLDGLENMDLVCLDDVDAISGEHLWELGLFSLLNRLRDAGRRLAVAASAVPRQIGIGLPDLASRLGACAVFHLQGLRDDDKLRALQLRAHRRGLDLPADVGAYLLRRYARDMGALYALLERLDRASLAAQRRLTVPFLRQVLGD